MATRVFSGARPTGRQHIGNYVGAIQNYVKLQAEYDCIYCIADVHALTTLEDTSKLPENIYELALDWLAAGIDPEKSIFFVQSHVPEVLELHTYLSTVTPLSWLLRVPTFKEKVKIQPHNVNYGLVGYPVLMTADIILYKAEVVPVGEDQLPHLELTREIVRRFNNVFSPTFPEPEAKLTTFPLIVGLDGKEKMSKQLGNDIEIALSPEETIARVMTAATDPTRRYRNDPGHPKVCNIYRLHHYFNPSQTNTIAEQCHTAKIGCVECKRLLAEKINATLELFRERRAVLATKPKYVADVLTEGAERARIIARKTLGEVKLKMKLI
ncbi:MAG: tryptophan--tRNA ligase [Dehalococcoidales bacterium]|jgi:tryptophanyl-tRNA synthetase|nr:tryptophan--tRNA ligase [Dehalococcoidales bacterium]MDP6737818.1 tryptophan--tRNA ligase [Dehalococcoidales bacterium]|tara:strand:+ start:476 stop:1450 length:975 start_codon:yes stop_codon:yes gene_type:complete